MKKKKRSSTFIYIFNQDNERSLFIIFLTSVMVYIVSLFQPPLLGILSETRVGSILTSEVFVQSSNNISMALFSAYIVYYYSYIIPKSRDKAISEAKLDDINLQVMSLLSCLHEGGSVHEKNLSMLQKLVLSELVAKSASNHLKAIPENQRHYASANKIVEKFFRLERGVCSKKRAIVGMRRVSRVIDKTYDLKVYYGFYDASQITHIENIISTLNEVLTNVPAISISNATFEEYDATKILIQLANLAVNSNDCLYGNLNGYAQ
ncbi:hypothetical protein K9512_004616 [Vibrio parahaemolyticus]|nr:hypothetical protein [Vibrio parahaemolyticus]